MKTGKDVDKCLDIVNPNLQASMGIPISVLNICYLLLLKIKNSKTTTQIWCTTY